MIYLEQFSVITFPIACLLINIFIIRTKRTSLIRQQCHVYGIPPMLAGFLSQIDRKVVAIVFAICSNKAINSNSSSSGNDGVIITYLKRLLKVLFMDFRYYPILAVVYINSILTLSITKLYAWLDYARTVLTLSMCEPDYYPTYEDFFEDSDSIKMKLEYYSVKANLIAIQL